MATRNITRRIVWANPSASKRFSSLIDFLCPDGRTHPDYAQALDISALDNFWKGVLDDKTLPEMDRTDALNDSRKTASARSGENPGVSVAMSNNGYQPTHSLKRKRSEIEVIQLSVPTETEESSGRKKYRIWGSKRRRVLAKARRIVSESESDEQEISSTSRATDPPETATSDLRTPQGSSALGGGGRTPGVHIRG